MNRHVSEFDLALASGGDLPRWKAYFVRRHLKRCEACAKAAAGYGESRSALCALAEADIATPNWLAERIMARASAQPEGCAEAVFPFPSERRRLVFAPVRAVLAAAVMLALLAVGVFMIKSPLHIPVGESATSKARQPAVQPAVKPSPEAATPATAASKAVPPPVPVPSVQAHSTRNMLVGEARNAHRHERLVMYTSGRGGLTEVSATETSVNVTQADPATGVLTITRVIMEEP